MKKKSDNSEKVNKLPPLGTREYKKVIETIRTQIDFPVSMSWGDEVVQEFPKLGIKIDKYIYTDTKAMIALVDYARRCLAEANLGWRQTNIISRYILVAIIEDSALIPTLCPVIVDMHSYHRQYSSQISTQYGYPAHAKQVIFATNDLMDNYGADCIKPELDNYIDNFARSILTMDFVTNNDDSFDFAIYINRKYYTQSEPPYYKF